MICAATLIQRHHNNELASTRSIAHPSLLTQGSFILGDPTLSDMNTMSFKIQPAAVLRRCGQLRRHRPRCPIPAPQRLFATAADTPRAATFDNRVKLIEVGPRDGLQNEKKAIPLATKIELIERLAKTGLTTIEAGSFVSPKWVPQMESSAEILEHILKKNIPSATPISYAFLAPNTKGLSNALDILRANNGAFITDAPPITSTSPPSSKVPDPVSPNKPAVELAVFAAATESFSQKNLNCSIAESLDKFRDVMSTAKAAFSSDTPLRVRAYISVVLGCPFEGPDTDPHRVAEIATDLLEMGADEISLGDTTGMGTAPRTKELLRCITASGVVNEDVALHLHDTYGQALVNAAVALEHGVRRFDCSVGGLGGCPYSPGATGNVATEDVVYFMESLGMETGVDLDAVADIGDWISQELGKPNAASVGKAVLGARRRAQ